MSDSLYSVSTVDNALAGSQVPLVTAAKFLLVPVGTPTELAPVTVKKNTVVAKCAANTLNKFDSAGGITTNIFYGIVAQDVTFTDTENKSCPCFIGGQFDPENLIWENDAVDGTGSTCIDDARLKGIFLDKNNV